MCCVQVINILRPLHYYFTYTQHDHCIILCLVCGRARTDRSFCLCSLYSSPQKAAMASQGKVNFCLTSWQGNPLSSQHSALIFFSLNSWFFASLCSSHTGFLVSWICYLLFYNLSPSHFVQNALSLVTATHVLYYSLNMASHSVLNFFHSSLWFSCWYYSNKSFDFWPPRLCACCSPHLRRLTCHCLEDPPAMPVEILSTFQGATTSNISSWFWPRK